MLAAHNVIARNCSRLLVHQAITTDCNILVHRCRRQQWCEKIHAPSRVVIVLWRELLLLLLLRRIVKDLVWKRMHLLHQILRVHQALPFKLILLALMLHILLLLQLSVVPNTCGAGIRLLEAT